MTFSRIGLSLFIFSATAQAKAATLFFLAPSAAGECQAKTIYFPSKTEKLIFSAAQCPEEVIWPETKDRLFYVKTGHLWEQTRANPRGAKDLGALPDPEAIVWLDKASGHFHAAYLAKIEASDILKKGSGENRKVNYRFEGKELNANDLPSWGVPYVAVAAVRKNGKWQRLEEKATVSEADETPGLSVLKAFSQRKPAGISLSALKEKSTCAGGLLNCESEEASLKKLIGKSEAYGVLEAGHGNKFAFAVIFGHTFHASAPVFFCRGSCLAAKKLKEVTENQIALAAQEGFVLVASEYSNDKPFVYDGKSGHLVWNSDKARSAVWLPGD